MGQKPPKPMPPDYTGADNFAIGYEARQFFDAARMPVAEIHLRADDTLTISDSRPNGADAPDFCHCAYCGMVNRTDREECRSCRAPLPERTARVRETVTAFKGVPLSRLTDEERDEMAEFMTGPDAWRHPFPVLDADMDTRVLAAMERQRSADCESLKDRWEAKYKGTESWADIAVLDSGLHLCGIPEQGDNKATQRSIIQRVKQFMGLR